MATPADELAEAFARHRQGELDSAERGYRAVLKAQPGNPDALYLMGMLCLDSDRPAEAARHLDHAVKVLGRARRPIDPAWRLALGTALQRAGKPVPALAAFDAALQAAPRDIDALFCRATVLQDAGRLDEAVAGYEAVLKIAPKHAEAANNLGVISRDNGNPAAAMVAFRRAVAARPNYTDALCNLGYSLADAGRSAEAAPLLRAAADARPGDVDLNLALFDCLVQANMADEAEKRARAFLGNSPDVASIISVLGVALEFLGRKEEAATLFARAIELDPANLRAYQGLADMRGEAGKESHIGAIRRALESGAPEDAGSAGLWFALARHLGAAGRDGDSLDACLRANSAKRAGLVRLGYAYDRAAMERTIDRLIATFPSGSLEGVGGDISEKPVFVLGMPRSGTTLTEQILASHPMVHGAGELGLIGQIADRLTRLSGYQDVAAPPDVSGKAAGFYLDAIGRMGGDALRVTDKMPKNFMYIGLIASILAGARIIHCRRDPMDTGLSCFMQNFRAGDLAWACDLADIGHYYCQYRRIMDHWRRVLPAGRMLEVDYEDIVADLESQARRIVDFAELPWDDACLRFHEAKRSVITASHSQVRRKIYSTSVGRWKRYGAGVQPLVESLGTCGCGPES